MRWPYYALLALLAMIILIDDYGGPDIHTDNMDGNFFAYTGLITGNSANTTKFTDTKATAAEFPGLLGQSISLAALVFGSGTRNPPHIHPRASELLYVLQGPLQVGIVDHTAGKVYIQTLRTDDLFVFPRGTVHFQFNNGTKMVRAFSAFGSDNPDTLHVSAINDVVLEKSCFHIDQATVEEDNLAPYEPYRRQRSQRRRRRSQPHRWCSPLKQ